MVKKDEKKKGKQETLFEIHPEKLKEILAVAELYEEFRDERLVVQKKEIEQKKALTELIHKSGLQELPGGIIKFNYEDLNIKLEPVDEKLTVSRKASTVVEDD